MENDAIAAIEYESMVFSRHLAGLPGRSRRTRGVLDTSAYTLLSVLRAGGPMSIGELSAVTGLDTSTLNRQTAALLRDGLADRIPDPDGGIARKFRVSEPGVRVFTEERAASRSALAAITADWDAADRETFAAMLRRLNEGIESRLERPWPRPSRG